MPCAESASRMGQSEQVAATPCPRPQRRLRELRVGQGSCHPGVETVLLLHVAPSDLFEDDRTTQARKAARTEDGDMDGRLFALLCLFQLPSRFGPGRGARAPR